MNEHSDQPTNDPTADRLRDAMQAQAAGVQPTDAWPTIVERLDGRRSPWAWVGQHPLVLGAGAAALVLIAILTVNLLTGDEQAEDVRIVGPPSSEDYTLMAVTTDGRLVELDADGNEIAVRSEPFAAGPDGTPMANPSQFEVSGEHPSDMAWFLRSMPESDACDAGDQVMTGLDYASIEVPVDREPGPVIDPVEAFSISPDGTVVAYVARAAPSDTRDDPRCLRGPRQLVVRDVHTSEVLSSTSPPGLLGVDQIAWLDDGRVAVLEVAEDPSDGGGFPALLYVVDPYVVDPESEAQAEADPPQLPSDVLIGTDGAGGLLAVGSFDWDAGPADLGVARVGDDGEQVVFASISPSEFDLDVPATIVPGYEPLTPLSISATPDGGAYVTVEVSQVFGPNSQLLEEPGRVLFHVSADGDVERLADGILSVAVRPGGTDVPDPVETGDAGPVVGSRPGGQLALLDPSTGEVVSELLAIEEWPEANRPNETDSALLTELAVDGQDVFTTRPLDPEVSGVDCAEGEFQADWDVWRVPLAGDHAPRLMVGGLDAEPLVLPPTAPPSRMPALSPEGSQIAYVTTSNGTRCDGALMVAVADLSRPTDVLATHTLGIGIEPVGVDWTVDGRLVIQLVAGSGADFPGIIPVSVDPAVSGPVGFEDSPVALNSPVELAASADEEWLHLIASPLDDVIRVSLDEIYTDVMHEAPASVDLPVGRDEGAVTSLAVDSTGAVWITVGLGEPVWPLTGFESYRTYRWELPVRDELTEAVEVSDELSAVAASPFEVDRADHQSTGTTMPADPDTTEPTGTTVPAADGPAFVYVSGDGELVRQGIDGSSDVVMNLPVNADGDIVAFNGGGTQLAATPDGRTVYLALVDEPRTVPTCSEGDLYSVDLASGEVTFHTDGRSPAVSPDGTRLAYSLGAERGDEPGQCQQSLVVEDLESGERTVWEDGYAADAEVGSVALISAIHWTADGEHLVFERQAPEEGAYGVYIADVDAPAGVLAERPLTLPDALPGDLWSLAGVLPLDSDPAGLIVIEPSCFTMDGLCPDEDFAVQLLDVDGGVTGEQPLDARFGVPAVGPYGAIGVERCDYCGGGASLWFQPLAGEAAAVVDGSEQAIEWAWLP